MKLRFFVLASLGVILFLGNRPFAAKKPKGVREPSEQVVTENNTRNKGKKVPKQSEPTPPVSFAPWLLDRGIGEPMHPPYEDLHLYDEGEPVRRANWYISRRYEDAKMSGLKAYAPIIQEIRWTNSESCSQGEGNSLDLLKRTNLKNPHLIKQDEGKTLSYYRYFIFEGKYFLIKGVKEEGGFSIELRLSLANGLGVEKWEPVVLPSYRGELLTKRQMYKIVDAIEAHYESMGAQLKTRSLVLETKDAQAFSEDQELIVGFHNGEITQFHDETTSCLAAPEDGAPLDCRCE